MRTAKDFFAPLAVGAPAPLREIPARPSRAIHFFDPGNPKMAAFFTSLLPQFGASFAVLELLGLVFCAMTFFWLACCAPAKRAQSPLRGCCWT